MSTKIAINGFGRIGRLVVRALIKNNSNLELVGINDLTNTKTLAHLFKYDTAHGKFDGTIDYTENSLIINGKSIEISAERRIEDIPWKNIDIVLESTGVFTTREAMQSHVNSSGAKKVLLSAPAKGNMDATVVLGVNDEILKKEDVFISNASCTTNCLAPMVKVLNDNFGIESGYMLTVHAYTNDQNILDLPHSDLRRARAAAANAIPTTTGAAKAVGLVIPEMTGKLLGYAIRIPVPDGSITDFSVVLKKEATAKEINKLMKEASESGSLKGILEYSDEPLVSSDIIGNSHSCVFDSELTSANGKHIKVVGWYDNEFGYANRIADMLEKLSTML